MRPTISCAVHGELSPEVPIAVIAPHVSALDGLFWIGHTLPRPVALAPYAKLPVVSTLFRAVRGIAVPLRSANAEAGAARKGQKQQMAMRSTQVAVAPVCAESGGTGGEASGDIERRGVDSGKSGGGGTSEVRAIIQKHKREFVPNSGEPPVMLLPEGSTHNGQSLLKFFSGAFEGGGPMQPVLIKYPYTHFNDAAFLSSLPAHLLRMLCAPWLRMEVTFLPVYHPSAEEEAEPQLYADNVRATMSEASGLPLSSYSAKELRQELRERAGGGAKNKSSHKS